MTVYNMPLWLRKFTFNKLNIHFDEQNSQNSGGNKGDTSTNDLSEARNILQKAQKKGVPSPQQSKESNSNVKVPDFITSARKTS
jgi:cell division protein FtsL